MSGVSVSGSAIGPSGALAFYSDFDDFEVWKGALQKHCPELEVVHSGAMDDPLRIHFVMAWKPPEGFFAPLKNLRLFINLGAGVDSLVGRRDLPSNVPVTRISDPHMARMMAGYVLFSVIRYARDIPHFEQAQRKGQWAYRHPRSPEEVRVAVLGLGELGGCAARELHRQGFTVSGWSRSQANIEGVRCFAGMETLDSVLSEAEIVVVMLPLTPSTRGLLTRERLMHLPRGAFFINVARGTLVDQAALTELLQNGHLGGATLDVFEREPLPAGDPLRRMENVLITPHLASVAIPASAAGQVIENIRAASAGGALRHVVDLSRGY